MPRVQQSLFPFEFHLASTPLSAQAKSASRERWKVEVADAARQRAGEIVDFVYLEQKALSVTIYYFPIGPMIGDVDNIVKPIVDALIGQAYLDDRFVERVVAQKFEPGVDWSFTEPSEPLSAALDRAATLDVPTPVVYVRVDDDLSWRRL